jgi:hypothetical protein
LFTIPLDSPFRPLFDLIDSDISSPSSTVIVNLYEYPFLSSQTVNAQFFDICLSHFIFCLKSLSFSRLSQLQLVCVDALMRHHSVCKFIQILEKIFTDGKNETSKLSSNTISKFSTLQIVSVFPYPLPILASSMELDG